MEEIQEIQFDPAGLPLTVKIVYEGLLVAGYAIKLGERNSNQAVMRRDGDNVNPEDDAYVLPAPAGTNDGRVLRLVSQFKGIDKERDQYCIKMEIYQDEDIRDVEPLGVVEEKDTLTHQGQTSVLFAMLNAKP